MIVLATPCRPTRRRARLTAATLAACSVVAAAIVAWAIGPAGSGRAPEVLDASTSAPAPLGASTEIGGVVAEALKALAMAETPAPRPAAGETQLPATASTLPAAPASATLDSVVSTESSSLERAVEPPAAAANEAVPPTSAAMAAAAAAPRTPVTAPPTPETSNSAPVTPQEAPIVTAPPTGPTSIGVTVEGGTVALSWGPADGAVTGYRVLRDGALMAELGPDARSFRDSAVPTGRPVPYGVQAVGPGGVSSPTASTTVAVSESSTSVHQSQQTSISGDWSGSISQTNVVVVGPQG